jgi:hypothetical protein
VPLAESGCTNLVHLEGAIRLEGVPLLLQIHGEV